MNGLPNYMNGIWPMAGCYFHPCYSPVWVNGSANQKTSNIVDHAKSDQHAASLSYQRKDIAKATNQPVESYAPIAKVRMMHKFEICYVIAREGLAFLKYPALHALAERQGVELGSYYKRNDCASSLFSEIDEMLLRLFYLYFNSPKKSKELDIIAGELKEVYELPKKGNLPVRCQGTHWIGHKRRALQRIVDRFGVYIIHLTNLIEDPAVKPADKCKLKGYLLKWSQGKMLIGLFNVY